MSKIHKGIIIVAVCISIFMILSFTVATAIKEHVRKNESIRSLLMNAGCEGRELNEKLIEYSYWKDALSYTSGYEIAVFEVNAESWTIPEGWRLETIAAAELDDATGFAVPERRFSDLKTTLPAVYDAWFFAEMGREGPFEEWQYHIGLYSDEGILLIYRGHDLNTDIWMRI